MAKHSTGSYLKGFVLGGMIGMAAALLMAPQSGEETRTQIKEKGLELREQAEAAFADAQARIEKASADLKIRVDDLSAKMDQVIVRTRADLAQATEELAHEVAPTIADDEDSEAE